MRRLLIPALFLAFAASPALAEPFTYQGTLDFENAPANGNFDFTFTLTDAQSEGNQLGPRLTFNDITVTNGTFTLDLDFGDNLFLQDPRYLNINVKQHSAPTYTPLPPQRINRTPFAHHATTATQTIDPVWAPTQGSLGFTTPEVSRVLINRTTPINSNEFFGVRGDNPTFNGMFISGPTDSIPFYGYATGSSVRAYTYYNDELSSWGLFANSEFILTTNADNDLFATNTITAEDFAYTSPKESVISIAGATFTSGSGNNTNSPRFRSGIYQSDTGPGWLTAPVNLPHRATITSITFRYTKTVPGELRFNLLQIPHDRASRTAIATRLLFPTSPDIQSATYDDFFRPPLILNDQYAYTIRVGFDNWPGTDSLAVHSVTIHYTVDHPE